MPNWYLLKEEMQPIIDYFKNFPEYTITLIISAIVCIVIIALILFFYKKSKLKNVKDGLNFENNLNFEQNSYKNQSENDQPAENTFPCDTDEIANAVCEEQPVSEESAEFTSEQNDEESENAPLTSAVEKQENVKPKTSQEQKTQVEKSKKESNSQPSLDDGNIALRYVGKWVIYEDSGRFFADLKASNGEIMLRTESYSSLSGIKNGIETLKKNIELDNFSVNLDKNGNFVFKIFSTANRLLCVGEGYSTKDQCEKAFASVKRFSKTAKIIVYRESEE